MEDLIYLIILIAWAVFAFYRQSQKKKAKARPFTPDYTGEEEEHTPNAWEEILFGGETEEKMERAPEPELHRAGRRWNAVPEAVSLEQMYMKDEIESLEDPFVQQQMEKKKLALESTVRKQEKHPDQDSNFLSDFDLRKAVIYAEILYRPYD